MTGSYRRRFCAVAALAVFASIGSAARAVSPDDLASAKATIAAVNLDWVEAMKARDAHRIADPYAEDSVSISAKGVVIIGRAALEQAEAKRFADGALLQDGALTDDGLQVEGELIYEWGHGVLRWATRDSGVRSTFSHFLTVWRQDPDHRWRIIRNLSF